jgi:signal transduction histidine kinase
MKWLLRRVRSTTGRLAATYLGIIMLMSIGFSFVFYAASAHELGRQIPSGDRYAHQFVVGGNGVGMPPPDVEQFLRDRAHQGRVDLLVKLIVLNVAAVVIGSAISWFLARRTLTPIEAAMDAQSQFVSDASHELRTPLTAMQTANQVALRSSSLTLKGAKEIILQNNEDIARLQNLSEGLLNSARQDQSQSIQLQSVDLQEIVSESLNMVIPQAMAKQITIEDAIPRLKVQADPALLVRVFVILLDNAIKYSADKTGIVLTASQSGTHAIVSVQDHGQGISADDLPNVFQRFYRADSSRTGGAQAGFGLGLSLADRIIGQHGGVIHASSQLGAGSIFSFELLLSKS